jgi:DNA-binding NtrC family response regulator
MTDEKDQTAADLTAGETGAGEGRGDRAFLVVYQGDGSRVVELLDGVEVTFGRSRGNTVVVEGEKASRNHARVVRRGADISVEDLGSRNGTRVNGAKIEGPARLSAGDEIAVGGALAVVGTSTQLRRRALVGSMSYLEERLAAEVDRAVRYKRPLAVLMLRLDGPIAAAEVALDRVAASLRRMDCLAEYGPDELAIVVPEADRAAAEATARRVVREARAAGHAAGVVACVGVAVHPDDGTQAGELVSRARSALRTARTGGGDGGVASAPVEPEVSDRDLVIADPQMRRVYELVTRVADSPIAVLILGETGVGKELVAEALHRRSRRAAAPFVKLNCASLPETLLESELFGHERGAFTGADRRKLGYFEAAAGGTILLDEIGELPVALQAKLLRVLERHKVTRLGGTAEVDVDVRVACATNRDLEEEVRRGRFREDLFFRVSAFTLLVPPLRDRRVEIRPLAEHFARRFARELGQTAPVIAPDALAALEAWSWPGNVRELRNAIERAIVLAGRGAIELEALPDRVRGAAGQAGAGAGLVFGESVDMREHIAEVERAAIVGALESCGQNQTRAAQLLGISRRALIYKMEKHGLKPPPR